MLVGGASRRMGRPKAWVPVAGVAMANRVATSLAEGGCTPVVFVGRASDTVAPSGLSVLSVPDDHPGEGPLGGVLTAFRACSGDVVVSACDLPHLDSATVRDLIATDPDGVSAAVVARSGDHHVALALWRRWALAEVIDAFADGHRSWRSVLAALPTTTLEIPAEQAVDVDTPDDLVRSERRSRGSDQPDPRR